MYFRMASEVPSPALLYPGQTARPLVQLPRVHAKFDERFLQELLATNPELLPASSIRQDVGDLLCVGREVGVTSGSIDNLYLSTAGYPVLVETKLWRNPQARREVLSQTLDYIKDLARKDFDWFEQQWKIHRSKTQYSETSLMERISDLAGDETDTRNFIDRVNHALDRGDVLAMIVGDGIETRLQELVAHLCKDSAHLRYALALCELSFFQLGNTDMDGMIVVPRIVGNVEPVQRAYVRVDLADTLAGKLTVTPAAAVVDPDPRPVRVDLNEDEFLRSVEASVGPEMRQKIEAAYNELIASFGLEPDFKAAGLMLKIPHPEGERPGASVFAFQKNGKVYNSGHFAGQLRRWENMEPETVQEITTDYWKKLHEIDGRLSETGMSHLNPRQFIPFSEIAVKWPAIREAIGAVTERVRKLLGEQADAKG